MCVCACLSVCVHVRACVCSCTDHVTTAACDDGVHHGWHGPVLHWALSSLLLLKYQHFFV